MQLNGHRRPHLKYTPEATLSTLLHTPLLWSQRPRDSRTCQRQLHREKHCQGLDQVPVGVPTVPASWCEPVGCKLIEHCNTAQKPSGMNSNGDSPTPEEDTRVSLLFTSPRLDTPLARTPCSAVLSHDLEVIRKAFANISDVRRLMRIKPIHRERHWRQLRQAHINNGVIPKELGLDALFYRFASERSYCQRLSNLVPPSGPVALSTDLLCLSPPWVSGRWPDNLPFASRQRHSYPTSGDLPDPEDSTCARDSAYALWVGTTRWGTGEPGRLLQEIRKEHRIAANHELLVPWQNNEFHSMPTALRHIFYVHVPEWWFADGWTSAHMFIPLPPVLTYRASRLLPEASH
jgi:hypothetical protein